MRRLYGLLAKLALLAFTFMARFALFMALLAPFTQTASAGLTNRYVVKDNGSAVEPYDSWDNGAGDIQTAINYAYAGETVLVSAATYDTGGVTNYPTGTILTNRIAIWKAITVCSSNNNPTNSIIKGTWASNGNTNGADAVRCVFMTNGSALIGFTLTNGATLSTNETTAYYNKSSGGVLVYNETTNAIISNCVIAGNAAAADPGGVSFGTLYNCTLVRNSALEGGGVGNSVLYNCTLTSNSAVSWGGGAKNYTMSNCTLIGNISRGAGGGACGIRSLMYNCTLINNSALGTLGGGVYQGTQYNCTFIKNSAATEGGAACSAVMIDCTLISNSAPNGAGARSSTLSNCMLVANAATTSGGGANYGTLYNCTLISNSATEGGGIYYGTHYNCALSANTASNGGGMYNGTLYNCTLIGNLATNGGGTYNSAMYNCIIYFNRAVNGSNWFAPVFFTNCCTTTGQVGWAAGNITNDPMLVDRGSGYGTNHVAGNYRLAGNSPCVDTGINQDWMINYVDLDGRKRIRYGTVDMGAFEHIIEGTVYKVH